MKVTIVFPDNIMKKVAITMFLSLCAVCRINSQPANLETSGTPAWQFSVGSGALYAPAFLGSKQYQLSVVPDFSISYKESFSASARDGVSYNVLSWWSVPGWSAGPIGRYAFERKEDGENPFRIAGPRSSALRGLGNVDGTVELGGYVKYNWRDFNASVELRQGVNGPKGLASDVGISYTKDMSRLFYKEGPPIIVSFGPEMTAVNRAYNQAYFGVNASQSSASGLPQYSAGGGLLKYGAVATVVLPLSKSWSLTLLGGYDRLAGDAENSPLVKERGSPNQLEGGMFVSYSF